MSDNQNMRFFLLIISIFFWIIKISSQDITVPEDFTVEKLPISVGTPIGITFTKKDHGFIWGKDGKVWPYHDNIISTEPLIDISEEINRQSDHGLVGFVLDPSFLSNGYFYMMYGVDRHHLLYHGTPEYDPLETLSSQASIGRITRYKADENTNFTSIVEGSRHILIGGSFEDGLPILMTSHSTGSLVFGTDGTLMVSFGDGGSFKEKDIGNAADTYHEQSLADGTISEVENVGSFRSMLKNSACGKLLRINAKTGKGIPTNPYYDENDPDSYKSKVWSMGFRNPYKFMKIPNTGSHNLIDGDPGVFLLGDVGSSHWEELNLIDGPGKWYGWPIFEGHRESPGFVQLDAVNKETNNDSEDCDFYTFKDISSNVNSIGLYDFENPCDDQKQIPEEFRLIHEAPLLSYSSNFWNPPAKTTISGWDSEGWLEALSINETDSNVEGVLMEGGAILPGGFNRFSVFPDEYINKFFMGDYMGTIHTITFDDQYKVKTIEKFADGKSGMTDIEFNPSDGHLYAVHYIDNSIYKIGFGGALPPTIITDQSAMYGPSPLVVDFNASASVTNSDTPLSWRWVIDGDTVSADPVLVYEFVSDSAKAFEVELIVFDEIGKKSEALYTVSVNNTPPRAKIVSLSDGDTYTLDDVNTVLLKAEVSDDEYSNDELNYSWRVDLYHDDHFHPGPEDYREETVAFIDPVGCGLEFYRYKVLLTVQDPAGLSVADTVELLPYCGSRFADVFDLNATDLGNTIGLNWSITNDQDVAYFEIEKSDDFIFRTIDRVEKSTNNDYVYIDNTPLLGKNIYRLKAFNFEGNYLYSNKTDVIFQNDIGLNIYPNPAFDALVVQFKNQMRGEIKMSIIDMTGKKVFQSTLTNNTEKGIFESVDTSDFSAGLYYIILENDEWTRQSKFIKM